MESSAKLFAYAFALLVISIVLASALYYLYAFLNLPTIYRTAALVVLIIVLGMLVVETFSKSIYLYATSKRAEREANTFRNIIRLIGYSIVIILLLSAVNVNVTGVLIGAGFLGIVIGLAAQSTLSNIFSGLSIFAARPFEIGDRITFITWQYSKQPPSYPHEAFPPGYSGTVVNVGLIFTELKGADGKPITVPNNIINQALIINNHKAKGGKTNIYLELDKSVPFDTFRERITKEIMKRYKLKRSAINVMIFNVSANTYHVTIEVWHTREDEEKIESNILNGALKIISVLSKRKQPNI